MSMLEIRGLNKTYRVGATEIHALRDVDLQIEAGEFVGVMGRSGSGKSTLLYQMALLDEPTTGDILIDGRRVNGESQNFCTRFRLDNLGYVFQDYALMPELTAIENVMLPALMVGLDERTAREQARQSLTRVGLEGRLDNLPNQLSGGEQQRVSIARAVVREPKIIFADEPTASLDTRTAKQIMDLFQELNRGGLTVVMVTHESDFVPYFSRIVQLEDGQVVNVKS